MDDNLYIEKYFVCVVFINPWNYMLKFSVYHTHVFLWEELSLISKGTMVKVDFITAHVDILFMMRFEIFRFMD